jgi:hypothetical protein
MGTEAQASRKRRAATQQPAYIPTPNEIREACQEIQAGWSAWKERAHRAAETPWLPPGIRNANVMPRHDDG